MIICDSKFVASRKNKIFIFNFQLRNDLKQIFECQTMQTIYCFIAIIKNYFLNDSKY